MPFDFKQLLLASLTVLGAIALEGMAHASDYSSAASYNSPYGCRRVRRTKQSIRACETRTAI